MTRLFRSKSCGASSMFNPPYDQDQEEEEDEEEDYSPVTTPLISPERRYKQQQQSQNQNQNQQQFQILDVLFTVLRKSLVTCSVETDDMSSAMDIGWPTDVRHVSHVTFDRFNGFLGLPVELEPELPRKVPSASVRVFGVSANSMQCSFDQRGNSVPTILLMMQDRLYSEGGLQAEGIFRINAENSQEEGVRNQLNKGVVPHGIDVHCLAGLIKAWFRELPAGVLDCLTPEQVMHCNTEDECTQLLKLLPATESALLDWAINLMADVVQHENYNKMNARNIAMVFAPNMTQMADPLTALIHAVQVMNFLKTLIVKTLRVREESTPQSATPQPSRKDSTTNKEDSHSSSNTIRLLSHGDEAFDGQRNNKTSISNLFRSATFNNVESDNMEKFWCFQDKKDSVPDHTTTPGNMGSGLRSEYGSAEGEGILDKLKLKRGVLKLCRHPVFQLSKSIKKEAVGL